MSDPAMPSRSGGCLCGAVRYAAEGEPVIVAHCHCDNCRRGTGAGHSTGAMFPAGKVTVSGRLAEYSFASGQGNTVTRSFCPACGSPLFGRNTGMAGHLTIALGSFDDAAGFVPEVTIYARGRQPWDHMDETLETFETQPAWRPKEGG
jgi:hypothetical protein